MKKPICPRVNCKNPTTVHNQYGVLPCASCTAKDTKNSENLRKEKIEFLHISEHDRITPQRDRHAKDILQPFIGNKPNPEFAKAYPERGKDYFSEEELNKL